MTPGECQVFALTRDEVSGRAEWDLVDTIPGSDPKVALEVFFTDCADPRPLGTYQAENGQGARHQEVYLGRDGHRDRVLA